MFKVVKGKDLENYDEETRDLFRRRTHDPRCSYLFKVLPRRNRHNLPVIVESEGNPWI